MFRRLGRIMGIAATALTLLAQEETPDKRLRASAAAFHAGAAGPVGRDLKADTDLLLKAEVLCWSRTRGAFAGASLNGAVVESDRAETMRLYGRAWSNRDIIEGAITMPEAARILGDELAREIYGK